MSYRRPTVAVCGTPAEASFDRLRAFPGDLRAHSKQFDFRESGKGQAAVACFPMPPRAVISPAGTLAVSTSASALQEHHAVQLQLSVKPPWAGVSLAQRLGLVPAPLPPLSSDEWLAVHLRSCVRQDSAGECSICLRPFKDQPQVLLSCSHTFHRECMASFERFRREYGQARCCPLCRCQAYQKRRIADAEQLWRQTCATRIQAAWRGCAARRQYRAMRRMHPPPRHPALRQRWAAEQLEERSAGLVARVELGGSEVDALFAELEATAAATDALYTQLSSRCVVGAGSAPALPWTRRPHGGEAAVIGAGLDSRPTQSGMNAAEGVPGAGQHPPAAAQQSGEPGLQVHQPRGALDWEPVIQRCLERDERPECPICLAPLACLRDSSAQAAQGRRIRCDIQNHSSSRRPSGWEASQPGRQHHTVASKQQKATQRMEHEAPSGGKNRGLAVLSCSHAFHRDCLSALEAFALASDLGPPRCPCCRCVYERLDLV